MRLRTSIRPIRLVATKALFLLTLGIAALMLFMLPAILIPELPSSPRAPITRFHLDIRPWLDGVKAHLVHLAHGHLVPPNLPQSQVPIWRALPRELTTSLLVTGRLVGIAFVASILLGILAGWAMSRLSSRRLKRPVWGLTSFFQCLPDLLIATALNLVLFLYGQITGKSWINADLSLWQNVIGPSLALTLLATPYVSRVTAAAIDEVSSQLYIRTAVAKGLPPWRVLLKHMGKSVLVRLWTMLPVIAGLLISGAAVIEYMTEVPGVGRALILAIGPRRRDWYRDPYIGVFFLMPLLLIYTAVALASEAGLRWLDPRVRDTTQVTENHATRFRVSLPELRLREPLYWLRDVAANVREGLAVWVRSWVCALRDPMLLIGSIMVMGIIIVAVCAPFIAPYDPTRQFAAFQDANSRIWAPPFLPGRSHLLGTDNMGRDMLSRLIYGTRYALLFAALAVPARFGLAVVCGLLAASRGGWWDRAINWLTVFFTAVPQVLLPLAFIPMVNDLFDRDTGQSLVWGVALVALPGVPRLAGSIRQQALEALSQPFIEGAEAAGAGMGRILLRHVLPYMAPQLVTMLALEVPIVMTLAATLAYFKASPGGYLRDSETFKPIAPRIPEWGSLMENPMMVLLAGQWWMWAPFGAMFLAVLAFNLLGEGLRRRWSRRPEWQ